MTQIAVGVVDVFVIRIVRGRWRVLVLRRSSGRSPGSWETVHGKIEPGESPPVAARRELREETNIRSVRRLGTIRSWLTYDIPPVIAGQAWKGKYRGQKQKWFALLFTGEDSEINIHSPDGHKPEFIAWKWEPMKNLPDLVVPFKRDIYVRVVKEFSKFTNLTKHAKG